MKKLLTGFIAGVILTSAVATYATSTYIANVANFPVTINGEELKTDEPILVVNNRTYLPLRETGEALDVDVQWNKEERKVIIVKGADGTLQEIDITNETFMTPLPEVTPIIPNIVYKEVFAEKVESTNLDLKSEYEKKDNLPYLIIKNDIEYIPITCFRDYVIEDSKTISYSIQLPNKEPVIIIQNKKRINAIEKIGRDYVSLSVLGLKSRVDNETIWIEPIEPTPTIEPTTTPTEIPTPTPTPEVTSTP